MAKLSYLLHAVACELILAIVAPKINNNELILSFEVK